MPDIHLKFGGSTATRTLNCPAWVNLAADAPQIDRESDAAKRGTMLHDKMENFYKHDTPVKDIVTFLSDEDTHALLDAIEANEEVLDIIDAEEIVCEEFVTLDDDVGGSVDQIAAGPEKVAIIDYKFGHSPVTEIDQFMLYACAAQQTESVADLFDGREVLTVIIQPAVHGAHAVIAQHSQDDLDDFARRFMSAVDVAETGTKQGQPGPWCRYCPAAGYCSAKRKQIADLPTLHSADITQLAALWQKRSELQGFINDLDTEVYNLLKAGHTVPGVKLVNKQAQSRWIDEQKVLKQLRYDPRVNREMYIEEKLRSPTQVKNRLKGTKVNVDEFITKKSSGTTVVKESDKREAVNVELGSAIPDTLANAISGGKVPDTVANAISGGK